MKNLIELEKELESNFINTKIDIELDGDISYRLKIENTQFLLNKLALILSDKAENQIVISLDEVDEIQTKDKYIEILYNYEQKIKIFT